MKKLPLALSGIFLLSSCTVVPPGPSVLVLPGANMSAERFRSDDQSCRQQATQLAGTTEQAGVDAGVRSAVIGTLIGALAGAAIGGGGRAAAVGAGSGLIFGSAAGAGAAQHSGYGVQQQYDNAYIQCMYSYGHRVPVPAGMTAPTAVAAPPPPPPPPGMPPPPPPR